MARGVGGHSPSNIAKFLRGMDFPAHRQELMNKARENGAPSEVMDIIRQLPEMDFNSMADVMKGVGEVE